LTDSDFEHVVFISSLVGIFVDGQSANSRLQLSQRIHGVHGSYHPCRLPGRCLLRVGPDVAPEARSVEMGSLSASTWWVRQRREAKASSVVPGTT
jgi:hypothetical protein